MTSTNEGMITFDESAWPFIIGTCPPHLGDASVRALITFFEAIHARRECFAVLLDTRPLESMPDARWRQQIAAWGESPKVQGNAIRYSVATAIVTSSIVVRGVYIALGWLWKPASPVSVLPTMEEATVWCGELLERRGVPLGPKARALLESSVRRPPSKGSRGDR